MQATATEAHQNMNSSRQAQHKKPRAGETRAREGTQRRPKVTPHSAAASATSLKAGSARKQIKKTQSEASAQHKTAHQAHLKTIAFYSVFGTFQEEASEHRQQQACEWRQREGERERQQAAGKGRAMKNERNKFGEEEKEAAAWHLSKRDAGKKKELECNDKITRAAHKRETKSKQSRCKTNWGTSIPEVIF